MSTLRWHGGKTFLAPKLRGLFPGIYQRYREPFFGGGSVLFSGDGYNIDEKVNDIYGELINFWSVLADNTSFLIFQRLVEAIPFGKPSFDEAGKILDDAGKILYGKDVWPKEYRATAFFIRNRMSRQGLGKDFATPTTRLRAGMNENVSAWLSAVDGLFDAHQRLRRVEICQMDAVEFILQNDDSETFHYIDPPYLDDTRSSKDEYVYEYSTKQHETLLNVLSTCQSSFMLSGYDHPLYERYRKLNNWKRITFDTVSHAGKGDKKQPRTEVIWMNY